MTYALVAVIDTLDELMAYMSGVEQTYDMVLEILARLSVSTTTSRLIEGVPSFLLYAFLLSYSCILRAMHNLNFGSGRYIIDCV